MFCRQDFKRALRHPRTPLLPTQRPRAFHVSTRRAQRERSRESSNRVQSDRSTPKTGGEPSIFRSGPPPISHSPAADWGDPPAGRGIDACIHHAAVKVMVLHYHWELVGRSVDWTRLRTYRPGPARGVVARATEGSWPSGIRGFQFCLQKIHISLQMT